MSSLLNLLARHPPIPAIESALTVSTSIILAHFPEMETEAYEITTLSVCPPY
jgi:hypothetical protein